MPTWAWVVLVVLGAFFVADAIYRYRLDARANQRQARERHKEIIDKLQYIIDTPRREADARAYDIVYRQEVERTMPQRMELIRERIRRGEDPTVNDDFLWELAPPEMDRPFYLSKKPYPDAEDRRAQRAAQDRDSPPP